MRAVTIAETNRDFRAVLQKVADDSEAAILLTDSGEQVVVMPMNDYNAWQETHYLLSNPANAAHLRKSIFEAESGLAESKEMLDN